MTSRQDPPQPRTPGKSSKELPWDRLATSDPDGHRIYLYPADIQGRWKKLRAKLSLGLILFFLGLPWMRVGGHQALLLDIPHRRFAIFGLVFWAHDAPLLFFVIGGTVISIAFVTAIWGRVWCGWACPQTVFVEHVFRRVERWIEGDSLAQKKLDQGPLDLNKFGKKTLKWGIFSILALILSHSFLAYFVGTEELGTMMAHSPLENPSSFLVMGGIALAILFDFGWFREQFCTVVCPYGRFQSVLMDSQSTVVAYDIQRNDCVNCYRCVQVCPTGIDIRRGVQLECIACTSCMDACDDVMARLKKPLGLIRYGNQALSEGKTEASIPWFKRTRAWVYLALLGLCLAGLQFTVSHRAEIEVTFVRAVGSPYQEIPAPHGGTQIVNHFRVDLRNQTFEDQELTFTLSPEDQKKGLALVISNHKEQLASDELERADLFVEFPKDFLIRGRKKIKLQLEAKSKLHSNPLLLTQEVQLVGPFY